MVQLLPGADAGCPAVNCVDIAAETAVVAGLKVIPVRKLYEAAAFLEGELKIEPARVDISSIFDHTHDDEVDFADVKGLEIAATGASRLSPDGSGQIRGLVSLSYRRPPIVQ